MAIQQTKHKLKIFNGVEGKKMWTKRITLLSYCKEGVRCPWVCWPTAEGVFEWEKLARIYVAS